jgi:hypothetical protein
MASTIARSSTVTMRDTHERMTAKVRGKAGAQAVGDSSPSPRRPAAGGGWRRASGGGDRPSARPPSSRSPGPRSSRGDGGAGEQAAAAHRRHQQSSPGTSSSSSGAGCPDRQPPAGRRRVDHGRPGLAPCRAAVSTRASSVPAQVSTRAPWASTAARLIAAAPSGITMRARSRAGGRRAPGRRRGCPTSG